jgi:DDE superfamily endonuclease
MSARCKPSGSRGSREDPSTAPTADGVLVIDETGVSLDGHHTAHVGRQYLANLGKIDNGVVSVTSLWADERVYYPVDVEPYTPAHHFEKGKKDPQFRTKLKIAVELVRRAVQAHLPFRAVVADSFYGEDRGVKQGLRALGVGYVLALKPSHVWWHPIRAIGSFQEAAQAARWQSAERPGSFREGHAHVPRWLFARLVGTGSDHRAVWTPQAGARRDRDHRSDHLARPDYVLVFSPICQRPARLGLPTANWPRPVCRKWCDCMGYACGWSRATNTSNMNWAGRSIRRDSTGRCGGIGNWSAAPSHISWYHASHSTASVMQEAI